MFFMGSSDYSLERVLQSSSLVAQMYGIHLIGFHRDFVSMTMLYELYRNFNQYLYVRADLSFYLLMYYF